MTINNDNLISEVTDIFDSIIPVLDKFNATNNEHAPKAKLNYVSMWQEQNWLHKNYLRVTLNCSFTVDLVNLSTYEDMNESVRISHFWDSCDDFVETTEYFWNNLFKDILLENIEKIIFSPVDSYSKSKIGYSALGFDTKIIFRNNKHLPTDVSQGNKILKEKLDQYKLDQKLNN